MDISKQSLLSITPIPPVLQERYTGLGVQIALVCSRLNHVACQPNELDWSQPRILQPYSAVSEMTLFISYSFLGCWVCACMYRRIEMVGKVRANSSWAAFLRWCWQWEEFHARIRSRHSQASCQPELSNCDFSIILLKAIATDRE